MKKGHLLWKCPRLLTNPARDAGFVFYLAGGVSMKLRATGGSSIALVALLKDRTGGSRPARRLTFVHAATKVSKNAFLLAEGISLAGFL